MPLSRVAKYAASHIRAQDASSVYLLSGRGVGHRTALWISPCVRLKGGSNPLSRINLISAPLAGWGAPTGGKAHTDVQRTANAKIVGSNPTLPSRP